MTVKGSRKPPNAVATTLLGPSGPGLVCAMKAFWPALSSAFMQSGADRVVRQKGQGECAFPLGSNLEKSGPDMPMPDHVLNETGGPGRFPGSTMKQGSSSPIVQNGPIGPPHSGPQEHLSTLTLLGIASAISSNTPGSTRQLPEMLGGYQTGE